MAEKYDFVVIGAGVAGLAAGMCGARLGMKTLVLGASHGSEMPIGGVITTTDIIENYPGFERISGTELAEKLKKHAEAYEKVNIKKEKVVKVSKGFYIKTDKNDYKGKTILFATGTEWRKLPSEIKGGREFENSGISYCVLCDGPLYKNKTVAVIGGSDVAVRDALLLSEHAKKVYIIYRKKNLRAEAINVKRVEDNKKIEIITDTNVVEIKGNNSVKSVVLDKTYQGKKELELDGVFVAIGHVILSNLAKDFGIKLNEKGEIIINHKTCETNIPGVYAAGDVTDKPFKQAITGVAEGCTAAHSAYEYITKDKIVNNC